MFTALPIGRPPGKAFVGNAAVKLLSTQKPTGHNYISLTNIGAKNNSANGRSSKSEAVKMLGKASKAKLSYSFAVVKGIGSILREKGAI